MEVLEHSLSLLSLVRFTLRVSRRELVGGTVVDSINRMGLERLAVVRREGLALIDCDSPRANSRSLSLETMTNE